MMLRYNIHWYHNIHCHYHRYKKLQQTSTIQQTPTLQKTPVFVPASENCTWSSGMQPGKAQKTLVLPLVYTQNGMRSIYFIFWRQADGTLFQLTVDRPTLLLCSLKGNCHQKNSSSYLVVLWLLITMVLSVVLCDGWKWVKT